MNKRIIKIHIEDEVNIPFIDKDLMKMIDLFQKALNPHFAIKIKYISIQDVKE